MIKKRTQNVICMVICFLVLGYGGVQKVDAATLIKNVPKTYAFVSTDGEACSATVTAVVTQVYSEHGGIRSYTDRSGSITYKYVASYTIPQVTYSSDPKFVDANGNTVKTFSPWTKEDQLVSIGTQIVYSKKNTTNVGYFSGNGYYLMQGYMVGNSDYMVTPWYGNSVKLKLGNK